jgi:hypothetical protein
MIRHSETYYVFRLVEGVLIVAFGVAVQFKPNLFRIGYWKRTSILQRSLSPQSYEKFMRGLGWFCIVCGVLGSASCIFHICKSL